MDGAPGEAAPSGSSELLEVAYCFGAAVMQLATAPEPPRRRLVDASRHLDRVHAATSGVWSPPRLSDDLAMQVRALLDQLAVDGPVEATVAALDDAAVARTCRQVTALAFALHEAVATA